MVEGYYDFARIRLSPGNEKAVVAAGAVPTRNSATQRAQVALLMPPVVDAELRVIDADTTWAIVDHDEATAMRDQRLQVVESYLTSAGNDD